MGSTAPRCSTDRPGWGWGIRASGGGVGAHLCRHLTVHVLRQVRGQQVDGGGPHAVPAQGGVVLQAVTGAVLGEGWKSEAQGARGGARRAPGFPSSAHSELPGPPTKRNRGTEGGAACLHKLLAVGTPACAEWDGQVPDTRAIPRRLSPSETPLAGARKGRACSTPESPGSPGELGSGRRRRRGRGRAPPGRPPCSRPGLARAHPPPSTTCGPAGSSGLGEASPGGVRASLGAPPGRVQVSWGQVWTENRSDRPGRGQPGGRPIAAWEAADGPGQRERQAEGCLGRSRGRGVPAWV